MYDLDRTAQSETHTDDLTIGVVGGGSRAWARNLMNDLAGCPHLGGTVRLYDVDRQSAQQNAALGARYDAHPDAVSDWSYVAVDSLAAALDDADFVICSTQDPPSETMKHDLDIPAEYGIYQSVGDTAGPGGCVRALRTVPQYLEIGRAVREHCPDAWVLNFTNPMTVCVRTLYEAYADINAIGICHEVYGVQKHLAALVEEYLEPPEDVRGRDIDLNVKGINHFTWVDEARWNGRDLLPLLDRELAEKEPLPELEPGALEDASYYHDENNVAYDLYRRFGAFAAAGDRHLAEFLPGYLTSEPEVHRWGIRLTPSEHRVEMWPTEERRRQEILDGDREPELEDTGEEMVDIMCALVGLQPVQTNVNVPNRGQCPDLQRGAVVETNALFTADACTPQTAGTLPPQVRSLVERHVTNQETLIEAGVAGDLDLAFQAFRNDPLVSTVDVEQIESMFRDLISAQEEYFTSYDVDGASVMAVQ